MVLADRYRLVRRIAGGGMGTVHEALDERLGRRVAVKVLREEYADDPTFVARFEREARAAAGLSHPNVAQVLDTGRDGERHFIVMELVDGGDLGELLRDRGPLTPERAADLAVQICGALGAAHAAGIVHRDVKPGNVLLDRDGQVKVADFGIAQAEGHTSLTRTGSLIGTVSYLSPEQARGERATAASDVYATGVLLFEMLTGAVPFTGDSAVAVAVQHLHEEVPDVRAVAPVVPPALAAVVARATAKDPADRFRDGAAMGRALTRALSAPDAAVTAVLPVSAAVTSGTAASGTAASGTAVFGAGAAVRRLVAVAAVLLVGTGVGWALLGGDGDRSATEDPVTVPQTQEADPTPTLRPSPPPSTPAPATEPARTGPVVPPEAVGSDSDELEDRLKEAGYDVKKVDVESGAPEESVVATLPAAGEPLSPEQTVVLVVSTGDPPDERSSFTVPRWLVGADAKTAERSLKDADLDVEKVQVPASGPKDTVVSTWPAPGQRAEAGSVVLVVSKGG